MSHREKIPRPTVKRLSLYLRELEARASAHHTTISSRQLGDALDLTDAQVRKDLAYFGQFGHPGIGYKVAELTSELRKILGTDRTWRAVVVGAGNIGRAITRYGRIERKGFEVVALFDRDPAVIGTEVGGLTVLPITELARTVRELGAEIGMVAVPAEAAQDIADALVAAGVRGILNFAPRRLQVGDEAAIVSVDLSVSLEQLAFKISLGVTGDDDRAPATDGD
jgi:redox-sensing transcriptional repressor